ncbi:YlbF family regulator [Gorillibacterium timonense]|uniref:YlbF family regulator n=1 Tax=Gorillibacterium timonense TaxID=1689269 RepID=UPI00071C3FDD|nr:YlbF family regulator [Gorillibacterium timonense]
MNVMAELDRSDLLGRAYELGDLINSSAEMADYLYWKEQMSGDSAADAAIKAFQRKKDLFEECMRFGHFHPSYHKALDEAEVARQELDAVESIRSFKQAEAHLDDLLHTVAELIARSVSESVKVPRDGDDAGGGCSSGGCSSGGSCSGNCG